MPLEFARVRRRPVSRRNTSDYCKTLVVHTKLFFGGKIIFERYPGEESPC